jgi:GAF domain-containing protein
MEKGIVGFSVMNSIKVNVEDAYKDERFNRDIDIQTGYKTRSILVVPIINDKQKVMGAL